MRKWNDSIHGSTGYSWVFKVLWVTYVLTDEVPRIRILHPLGLLFTLVLCVGEIAFGLGRAGRELVKIIVEIVEIVDGFSAWW